MKKAERLRKQQELIAKINNAILFETLTLTLGKTTKESNGEINTSIRKAILKYKKEMQD